MYVSYVGYSTACTADGADEMEGDVDSLFVGDEDGSAPVDGKNDGISVGYCDGITLIDG